MPDCARDLVGVLVFVVVAGGLVGCGGDNTTSDFGGWTLQERGLTLTEDLLVRETDSFYFGSIAGRDLDSPGPGLDVLSNGRIVVADDKAKNIKVLRPNGTLTHMLGRPGQGPGEFQRIASVQVARGDSIYAYEGRRLVVFGPTPPHEVVRTVVLEAERMPPFQVLVTDTQLAALYGTPFMAGRDLDEPPVRHPWRRVGEAGTPGDTLFTTRMRRMASIRRGERRFSLYPMPFERTMPVTAGPGGRFYVGHTDSLHVTAYQTNGSPEGVASIPNASMPVRTADRDSALAGIDGSGLRSKITAALSDTKPTLTDLVVAADGTLWVRRPAEGPNPEKVPWWVLDPETKTIREVPLPSEVNLEVVQDGYAYGSTTTEAGAPAVVRYRIEQGA